MALLLMSDPWGSACCTSVIVRKVTKVIKGLREREYRFNGRNLCRYEIVKRLNGRVQVKRKHKYEY